LDKRVRENREKYLPLCFQTPFRPFLINPHAGTLSQNKKVMFLEDD
jgi:hypothetical protein